MVGALFRRPRRRRGLFGHVFVWLRNLLLIGIVLVAAARFYTEYRLDKQLDQLAGMVAPVGTLTFGKSYTAFSGDIGVETVSFIPDPGLDVPPATLSKGVLHTPGFLWVLGLRGGETIPPSMGITLEGLSMELGDGSGGGSSISGIPFETLACGEITEFQTIDLEAMGFGRHQIGLTGRYRVIPPERVELQMVVQAADAAETHVDIELNINNLMEFIRGRVSPQVELAALDVALHAAEFNRRRNDYCASQIEGEVEDFLSNHIAEAQEVLLTSGYTVGIGLLDQYRRFASGEGVWTFLGRPDRPVQLSELMGVDPLVLLELLNINAAIGSALPEPVVVSRFRTSLEGEQVVESESTERNADGGRVIRVTGQKRFSWVLVPLANVAGYVGRDVRIETRFGKLYAGSLTRVEDGQVIVQTRLPGGQAEIPIPLTQITAFRVRQHESG